MTARQIIVVDVETNGLDPDRHQAVEVAWWNLTTDERGLFIPRHNVSEALAAADIDALRVNRFIDRIAGAEQDHGLVQLARLHDAFVDFDEDDVHEPSGAPEATQVRHTLAGANPAFDAAFLGKLFAAHDPDGYRERAPWHHRLWDLSAYAAGVLGLDELPGLRTVCQLLLDDHEPDHTAEGDVTAAGLCFRALQQRARSHRAAAPTAKTGA